MSKHCMSYLIYRYAEIGDDCLIIESRALPNIPEKGKSTNTKLLF